MRSKNAVRNIIASVILQIVTLICGLIIPRLILSVFGSDVNGLVNSITQFLAYITLLESGFGPVVKSILYKPIADKNKEQIELILKSAEKFFRIIAIIFIVYIIILCVIYPYFVNKSFDTGYTISLIIIIGISTFAEYFFGMTYKLYLQADQKTYITSIIQIGTTILNTVLVAILIFGKSNIQTVKLISALTFIIRPILQNVYVKRKYNINLKKVTEDYKIKQRWDGLAQHIAGVIYGNTDITVLTIFSDIKEVSVYSVYYLVIAGVKNVVSILSTAIESIFGDMIAKNEKENLNKKYSMYEFLYFTIITVVYSCTAVLIVPFVEVYTKGVTDIEYKRELFAYIIVFAYFIFAIKTPYNTLAYAAGKFKETRTGAWIEAILNLVISAVLVGKYGCIGVAIGTLIAVLIRGIELIIFTSRNILERKVLKTFKKSILNIIQFFAVLIVSNIVTNFTEISYVAWIKMAVEVFAISIIIIIPINILIYKNEFKEFINIINIIKNKNIQNKPN